MLNHIVPLWYLKQWDAVLNFRDSKYTQIGRMSTKRFAGQNIYSDNCERWIAKNIDEPMLRRHKEIIHILDQKKNDHLNSSILDYAVECLLWQEMRSHWFIETAKEVTTDWLDDQIDQFGEDFSRSFDFITKQPFWHLYHETMMMDFATKMVRDTLVNVRRDNYTAIAHVPRLIMISAEPITRPNDIVTFFPLSPDYLLILSPSPLNKFFHKKLLLDFHEDPVFEFYLDSVIFDSDVFCITRKHAQLMQEFISKNSEKFRY